MRPLQGRGPGIVELRGQHAEAAQEPPDRGVVRLEQREQIHHFGFEGKRTGGAGAIGQVVNLGRGRGERQIAGEDRIHSSEMHACAQ